MTGDGPTIAVVIPARDEEKWIERALESVASQRYPAHRLRCVVVDNGSIDGTALVARRFADGSAQVGVEIVDEREPGVGRAKNRGAEVAGTVDVIIFLDADSRMCPRLAGQVARSYLDGRLCGSIRVSADGGAFVDRAFFALMELGKVCFGIRAQMLYCDRRLFWSVGGFRTDLRLGEDVEFLRRVSRFLRSTARSEVIHLRKAEIRTSTRRLASHHHLGMARMFYRWLLAFFGVGRTRNY